MLNVFGVDLMHRLWVVEQGMSVFMVRVKNRVHILVMSCSMDVLREVNLDMVWGFMDTVVSWLVVSMVTVLSWGKVCTFVQVVVVFRVMQVLWLMVLNRMVRLHILRNSESWREVDILICHVMMMAIELCVVSVDV